MTPTFANECGTVAKAPVQNGQSVVNVTFWRLMVTAALIGGPSLSLLMWIAS